jgi:hypothetical protein
MAHRHAEAIQPQRKWPHPMVLWLLYALLMSRWRLAFTSSSLVGRSTMVGRLPESHCWRQSMTMDDMGAGVWYCDRWVGNLLVDGFEMGSLSMDTWA